MTTVSVNWAKLAHGGGGTIPATNICKAHGAAKPRRISKTLEPMELDTAISPIPCRATKTEAMVSGTEMQENQKKEENFFSKNIDFFNFFDYHCTGG